MNEKNRARHIPNVESWRATCCRLNSEHGMPALHMEGHPPTPYVPDTVTMILSSGDNKLNRFGLTTGPVRFSLNIVPRHLEGGKEHQGITFTVFSIVHVSGRLYSVDWTRDGLWDWTHRKLRSSFLKAKTREIAERHYTAATIDNKLPSIREV